MSGSKNVADEATVACDLGCGEKVAEGSLAFHKREQCGMRTHQCGPCGKVMRVRDEQAHDAECPKMFVPCKWCGAIRIARRDIETHTTTCEDYPTYCRYALHGCTTKVVRRELPSHHEESAQGHMSLLTEVLEDIQDSVGGSGRLGSLASSDQASGELPLALWPKVQAAMTKEMSGTGHMDQRSHEERIANLEGELKGAVAKVTGQVETLGRTCETQSKESVVTKEELEKMITNKHAEIMGKLTNDNKKLSTTVERLGGEVAALAKTGETQSRETRLAREALNKRHAEEVEKLTNENKKMSETVAKLTSQIEALVENNESMDRKMKGMVEYGLPPTHSMDPTDDIVEDRCYRLPIYWSCKLEKGEYKVSPRFYLPDGYRLRLQAEWHTDGSVFVVGACLRKGVNDSRAGMWPWCGQVGLTVRQEGGDSVGEGSVVQVGHTGRTRPSMDDGGNGHYLIGVLLPCAKDQTSITVILDKRK